MSGLTSKPRLADKQPLYVHDGAFSTSIGARNFSNTRSTYLQSKMHQVNGTSSHRAFVALGSNVGSRIEMIEKACLEMDRVGIKVKRTSSLFETAPMYVLDQDPFINGVCEVSPLDHLWPSITRATGRNYARPSGTP